MERWTDQPQDVKDGEELIFINVKDMMVQISKVKITSDLVTGSGYALTAGNLFGSQTKRYTNLEELLIDLSKSMDKWQEK